MSKATESQKKLLIVLLMAIVFFAAYRFGYQPLVEQTDALAAENAAIEEEIADLKLKAANREFYETETVAGSEKVDAILQTFGPGVTPEKSILFFLELARVAEVQIPTISFGDASLLFTTSSLVGEGGIPYSQYAATYSVAYSTTYEGLKTLIAYINQYPEKMNLSTLTAAYNGETDSLSGNFSINWYMVTGTDKQYRFEDLETVDIGNENIFRSGSGTPGGDLDFNFDFGFDEDDGFEEDDGSEEDDDFGGDDGSGEDDDFGEDDGSGEDDDFGEDDSSEDGDDVGKGDDSDHDGTEDEADGADEDAGLPEEDSENAGEADGSEDSETDEEKSED